MHRIAHWEALSEAMAVSFLPLAAKNRYRLDLPSVTLERPPKAWLVDLVVAAGILARELTIALDIEEGHELLGQHTVLDRLDDALRVARTAMSSAGPGGVNSCGPERRPMLRPEQAGSRR